MSKIDIMDSGCSGFRKAASQILVEAGTQTRWCVPCVNYGMRLNMFTEELLHGKAPHLLPRMSFRISSRKWDTKALNLVPLGSPNHIPLDTCLLLISIRTAPTGSFAFSQRFARIAAVFIIVDGPMDAVDTLSERSGSEKLGVETSGITVIVAVRYSILLPV